MIGQAPVDELGAQSCRPVTISSLNRVLLIAEAPGHPGGYRGMSCYHLKDC